MESPLYRGDFFIVIKVFGLSVEYSSEGDRKMNAKSSEQLMILDNFKAETVIESFNNRIKKSNCEYMSVDISFLNVMDAMRVSTLCSTNHYVKYPNGRINWYVSSPEVERFSSALNLGNSKYVIKK